jgi:hypothetical protein
MFLYKTHSTDVFILNTYASHIKHGLVHLGYFNFGCVWKENTDEATDLPQKTNLVTLVSCWTTSKSKQTLPHSQV